MRTVLGFSLRCTDDQPTAEVAARVSAALGVDLAPERFEQRPAYVARVLGMNVALFPWGGPGGTTLHILEGSVNDPRILVGPDGQVDATVVDIADAVADVLHGRGGGSWHRPTAEEDEAHTAWSRAHED